MSDRLPTERAIPRAFDLADAARVRRSGAPFIAAVVVMVVVTVGPLLVGGDAYHQDLHHALRAPSWAAPLGTDQYGRDEFIRVIVGTRRSVIAAMIVVVLVFTIGLSVGALIAAAPRAIRRALSGVIDIGLGVPGVVVGIVVIGILGPGTRNTVIALSILGWCWYARLAQEHAEELLAGRVVAAARVAGVPTWRNLTGHVIPHLVRRLFVRACLDVGYVILMMASLSYLGLGEQEPEPELGQMLHATQNYVLDAPWLIIGPVLAIVVVVLPFVAAGERVHSRVLRT